MSEKKNWRVVKVTYVEALLTLTEALKKKNQLNSERKKDDPMPWSFYYRAERMED